MFITAVITSLCEQELTIVRAAKTCYAGRTLPTPVLELVKYLSMVRERGNWKKRVLNSISDILDKDQSLYDLDPCRTECIPGDGNVIFLRFLLLSEIFLSDNWQ